MQIDLTARPQWDAYRALVPGATVCTPWGRGGGKSTFLRLAAYLLVARWDSRLRPGAKTPGVRIVVLMPTLVQARKVHLTHLLNEIEGSGEWAWLGAVVNRSELRVSFPGGSWIQFVSAEAAQGSRGIRCDAVFVDEADDIDTEIVDAVSIPWFSEPHSLSMTLVSGTFKRGRYGLLYRTHARGTGKLLDAEGQRFADHASFLATCYDFPKFVSARAIEKARRETQPTIFAREWLSDADAAEGLVYSTFDEKFHVAEPAIGAVFSEVLIGGDHGWEDPGCFYAIGIIGSGADAVAHVVYEVYASHRDEDWWVAEAQKLVAWYPNAKWYLDPSRPDRIAALKSKAGIRLGDVDNSIEAGVDCVANLLSIREREGGRQAARLYVSPQCPNLIREFGLYRRKRDPKNRERILDDIEDKSNHGLDSIRYPLLARFRARAAGGRNDRGAEQRQ
jgi:hypothetical protein